MTALELPDWVRMLKKSIAATLLVIMVAWAEMAVAPMLALQPGRVMSRHMAAHHHVMPAGHPCCPGIGKTENVSPLEFAASGLPCHDQHRCCFQQGPQSVPAPVRAGRGLSRELAPIEIAGFSPAHGVESHVSVGAAAASGPPPSLLGMVLRV